SELFTHRVGRTGRMEREGEAITLVTPSDLPPWKRMQRDLGVNLPARAWPQDEMPLPPADPKTAPTPSQPKQRGSQPRQPERQQSDATSEYRAPRQPRPSGDFSRNGYTSPRRNFRGRDGQRPRGDR
ncbi:MAG TPA: DEAD/DEAH box helicase, partial [Ktedonobacterales bacterium]